MYVCYTKRYLEFVDLRIEPIEAKIIYSLKSLGVGLFVMLSGTFSTLGLARWLHMPVIGVIGLLVFFVGYLYYSRGILNYFTKRVLFIFHESDFEVEEFNLKTNILEKTTHYSYLNIKSCTLKMIRYDYSELFIRFENGNKQSFVLVGDVDVESNRMIYQHINALIRNSGK